MKNKILAASFLILSVTSFAQNNLKLTTGFSTTESIVGINSEFESSGVNFGIKRFGFNSAGDIIIFPGISYYHKIFDTEFYGSTSLSLAYMKSDNKSEFNYSYGYWGSATQTIKNGINIGTFALNAGRIFSISKRFTLNGDVGIETPLNKQSAFSNWNVVGGFGLGIKL